MELLAPAGSKESLIAAVVNGADAVYLGGTNFSARQYASNFTEKDLEEAVDYCHTYGVRVFITMNTLIKNSEMKKALDYAEFLYKIGVDALIVQDTGLIYEIHKALPDFELHASTQVSIHQGEEAKYFTSRGIKRIVLARELTKDEIKYISEDLQIETEIFIHGALCISYSGQCLTSSMIGGRSGNRGRCAQPCRMSYKLVSPEGKIIDERFILSPKEVSFIDNIDLVKETKATSLKIEGRMKRPEYVAATVKHFKNALEGKNDPEAKDNLLQLFNREGFSSGYLKGEKGDALMALNRGKDTGVLVGKKSSSGNIEIFKPLEKGDGIRIDDDGFIIEDIKKGKGGDLSFTNRKELKSGDIYKTFDKNLMETLKKSYENPYARKNPLDARISFTPGERASLSAKFNGVDYIVYGRQVEKAVNAPLSFKRLEKQMFKTPIDSPFEIRSLKAIDFKEGFLPMKDLNKLRRDLLSQIEKRVIASYKRDPLKKEKNIVNDNMVNIGSIEKLGLDSSSQKPKITKDVKIGKMPEKLIKISTKEQIGILKDFENINISFYPFYRGERFLSFKDLLDSINKYPEANFYINLPTIIKDLEMTFMVDKIKKLEVYPNFKGIITNNKGMINIFKDEFLVIGDYKLNVFNSSSLKFYGDDLIGSYISEELSEDEIKGFRDKSGLGVMVYGRHELMLSEHCPLGDSALTEKGNKACKEMPCLKGQHYLRDRKDEDLRIFTDTSCRSYIYSPKAKNIIGSIENLKSSGIKSFKIELTDESLNESIEITKAFIKEDTIAINETYKGRYNRGVE